MTPQDQFHTEGQISSWKVNLSVVVLIIMFLFVLFVGCFSTLLESDVPLTGGFTDCVASEAQKCSKCRTNHRHNH